MMDRTDRKDPYAEQARYNGLSYADFNTLGTYNAEVARGIMHTAQWIAKMGALQRRFNDGERARTNASHEASPGDGLTRT